MQTQEERNTANEQTKQTFAFGVLLEIETDSLRSAKFLKDSLMYESLRLDTYYGVDDDDREVSGRAALIDVFDVAERERLAAELAARDAEHAANPPRPADDGIPF